MKFTYDQMEAGVHWPKRIRFLLVLINFSGVTKTLCLVIDQETTARNQKRSVGWAKCVENKMIERAPVAQRLYCRLSIEW